ncbi:pyridoxamine 5'-phosphate oxidase family protein [Streptomyces sp. DSM 44915]|uniref:Pyridoxamine 5'-phosphate oxidase family protein n=1 Tax=Streptomyces chisholmiae TaxID=3075540 RepID=A0ABU2K0B1_9ACTN|nr:pyridoxamine 5'-phosphate oxidase family protein [Streptomyces sp. DSM 44915]MDT0270647.1 pyridoxamine 5'-phosphate oxidase family protein [Streptomyces sp. DSM 44915]
MLARFAKEEDVWVATTGAEGEPYLVPLSFLWWDEALWISTRSTNPTARNVARDGRAMLSLGATRDVVLVDATGEPVPAEALPPGLGDAFVAKLGWDPRGSASWGFLRFRPQRVQAWHEEPEMPDRLLMRDGIWLG